MQSPLPALPLTRDIVLIGGGHTHALVLRMWGMDPLPGARLTLINPLPTAAYSGMLPGHVAGHYPRAGLQLDLVRLARHAGARLILGRVTGIDRAARQVIVPGRAPVGYDIASVDIGITAEMPQIPGFAAHVTPAKPLDAFADAWESFARSAAPGARIAVIGGGVAGVELALAMRHRRPDASVTVCEAGPQALSALGPGARARMLSHCARLGVAVETDARVREARAGALVLADGRSMPAEFILGTGASKPADWLAGTGLALHQGFVTVGPTLQSSDPAIFAAGDIAHLSHAPRPKAGVYAVRAAPVLLANLRTAAMGAGRMRPYHPQRDYLKLISTGDRHAVADKWGLPLDGAWLWRWKDRIDRRFMAKVHDLPAMPAPALPRARAAGMAEALGPKPLCGGCGAKVGRGTLNRALAAQPVPARADVLSSPGDDAAVLAHGEVRQLISTDHLRAFTLDPWLFARLAAIHALGDIWAMGGAPQAALAQVTLPRMSEEMAARTLAEILDAAGAVFRAAGADLAGGHTSFGSELGLGFTVTGLAPRPVGTAGARPGDALILTKPIGSGVILAAEMALAAPGAAVATALAAMDRPLGPEAAILAPLAHAMTDVTGFGLAGHLINLCEASGTAAEIDLAAVPVLPGAEDLAAAGQHSSLLPQNIAALAGRIFAPDSPRAALLYDPQTAGGLLAALPAERAEAALAALQAAGIPAARIGRITAGAPFLNVV